MWKWIKIPKGVALLAFLLPWMSVSCSGTKIVSASGFGLAFGQFTSHMPTQPGMETPSSDSVSILLILGIVAIVGGLVLSFQAADKTRARNLAVAAGVALLLIWLGTMRYTKSALLAEAAKKGGNGEMDQAALAMIQIDWHVGYWVAVLALLVAAGMALLVYTGRDDEVEARVRGAVESARATIDPPAPPKDAAPGETHACPTCGKSYPLATRFCPTTGPR